MKDKLDSSLEKTIGYELAMSFKPFIDPKCSDHMEIVRDMARAINREATPPKGFIRYTNVSAAAPDMLNALQSFPLRKSFEDDTEYVQRIAAWIDPIRNEAIEKATGK